MSSETKILFKSDLFTITDFKCKCNLKGTSGVEYRSNFSMSYIRKGNFLFNVFNDSLDSFNGRILLSKPGFEHTVTHFDGMPDECTIFSFSNDFYETVKSEFAELQKIFFNNNDVQSLLVQTDAGIEHLHFNILKNILAGNASRLLIESFVLEILYSCFKIIYNVKRTEALSLKVKRNHLPTIEKAKQYISENFDNDISLSNLAENSYVSPFHFSRLFKSFTSFSPHQFLVDTRLKHAELLLKTTGKPITQVCFDSGFRSLEHFSSTFRQKYKTTPSKFRK